MKLGVGLPGYLGNAIDAQTVLDWARVADEAGFHAVAAHDRPDSDAWDPLATLAVAAPVTQRVRLATTVVLLPTRDEALVAKQASVIDQVSGGRLDFGVGLGGRAEDYEVFGRPFRARGRRLEEQLARMLVIWSAAAEGGQENAGLGPASFQRPHPRLWIGGYTNASIERAVSLGDGYTFGAPGIAVIENRLPAVRAAAAAAGRTDFPVGALAYVALTTNPSQLRDGERMLTHYYGTLRKPFLEMVHTGEADDVRAAIDAYRRAGVDVLYLFPVIPTMRQLELWSEELLPHVSGEPVSGKPNAPAATSA